MILEDAQQAVAATNRMLTAVRAGAVATTELRTALEQTRVFLAAGAAFQTAAAELIAAHEHHGDGGAEVLAKSAGLSHREAHSQVKTAQALREVPQLRDAVQAGEVSQANARRLADVITKTGADAVAGDAVLVKQAGSLRAEQFGVAARRWVTAQQGDNGVSEHARQRARRYLKFYNSEDGMIAMHGEFDRITGTRIQNRLRQTAAQFFDADKQLPESQRRKFPQCLADALELITIPNTTGHKRRIISDLATQHGQRNDADIAASRTAHSDSNADNSSNTDNASNAARNDSNTDNANNAAHSDSNTDNASNADNNCDCGNNVDNESPATSAETSGGWLADITVLARVDDATRELIYELSDGSQLPPAVIEELSCNARWSGLIFDRHGDALWRTRSRRSVSSTQWQALLATYDGCFHCGAPPSICQAHHITPYSQGGATRLDNLIMVCWNCHHNIHHHNWQIHKHPDDSHTLHPPNNPSTQPHHGPVHNNDWPPAPDPPSLPKPDSPRQCHQQSPIIVL